MGRILFFAGWTIALGASIYALMTMENVQIDQGDAIASLAGSEGLVQVRPEDFAIWNYVEDKQAFFEGNVLATGSDSTAKIEFTGGRQLEIAENTQIVISLNEGSRNDLVVTLLKGDLKALPARQTSAAKTFTKPKPMKIRAGKTEINLAKPSAAITLKTNLNQKPILRVNRGSITIKDVAKGTTRSAKMSRKPIKLPELPKAKPLPKFAPTKIRPKMAAIDISKSAPSSSFRLAARQAPVANTPPAAIKPAGLALAAKTAPLKDYKWKPPVFSSTVRHFWTDQPIAKGSGSKLQVPLVIPADQKNTPNVKFYLYAANGKGKKTVYAAEKLGSKVRSVGINAQGIRGLAKPVPVENSNAKVWEAFLAPTAKYEANAKGPVRSKREKFTFQSLADYGNVPVRLYLAKTAVVASKGWFVASEPIGKGQAKATLDIYDGTILPQLVGVVRGAERFGIAPGEPTQVGFGTFFVRGSEVIAKLSGKNYDQSFLGALKRSLNANLVYKGNYGDFVASSQSQAFANTILKVSQKEGTVFASHKGKMIRVTHKKLKKDPRVAKFLKTKASALFTRQVEILDVK